MWLLKQKSYFSSKKGHRRGLEELNMPQITLTENLGALSGLKADMKQSCWI
jgi:hypothetical protein